MVGLQLNQIINENNQDYYELIWSENPNTHNLIIHGIEPVEKILNIENVSGLTHKRYSLSRNMYVADLSDTDNTVLAFRVDNGVIIIVEDDTDIKIEHVQQKYNACNIYQIKKSDYCKNIHGCINFDIPTGVVTTGISDFLVCYKISDTKIVCQRLKYYTPTINNLPSRIYNRIGFKLYYNLIDNIHEAYSGEIQGLWLLTMPSGWNIPTDLQSRYKPNLASDSHASSEVNMWEQRSR